MPDPAHNLTEPSPAFEPARHKPDHTPIVMKSIYDLSCPRCKVIDLYIKLSRLTLANGAKLGEAFNARRFAQQLAEKHGLTKPEMLDRLYTSPSIGLAAQAEKATRRHHAKREEA